MSKREKILIAVAVAAILAFVYFNYFLTPVQKQTKELRTALQDNRLKAKEMEAYQKKIEEMNAELANVDEQRREEIAKIPAELDQAELMMEIDRITKENGRIEGVIFDPVEERTYYQAVPIVLEMYCTYTEMHSIIDQLEKSEYLNLVREIKVDTLTIALVDLDPSDGVGRKLDMLLTLDFIGLSVNDIVPGRYTFLDDGKYGNEELFGVYPTIEDTAGEE